MLAIAYWLQRHLFRFEMVNWFHPPLQTKVELRAGDTIIAVVRSARQLEPEQLHSIAPLPLPDA